MFEPDEYIFTKLAYFFKRKRKERLAANPDTVYLSELKPRLALLARALTGAPIEIYEAEEEGGYKNEGFFLPASVTRFGQAEENLRYYLYRLLYLSVQRELGLNWGLQQDNDLTRSRQEAVKTASVVLQSLSKQYPVGIHYHDRFKKVLELQSNKEETPAYHWLYGKWMRNEAIPDPADPLENFGSQAKQGQQLNPDTILKKKGVEELISVQIDKKQLEDAVLQHQFEKVETADEFGGNWRDMDGDDELEDHANALEDLNMKFTVRSDDMTHSVYQSEFMENTTIAESAAQDAQGFYTTYDEWDHKKRNYKPEYCKVYPQWVLKRTTAYYSETIRENASVLLGLRKMLSHVNNRYQQQRRQNQGDSFDLDALTDLFVELQSGHTPDERVYLSQKKKEKDLSILLLLDTSLSADGYAAGNRVIDVAKQTAILFGEILDEFGIDFSIDGFYSKTRNHTTYNTAKDFDEAWSIGKHKIGALEPTGYTRIGTALRHAGARLDARPSTHKWVILLSDGKPNDYDRYEGNYGLEDVKQALRELNQRHINSYALAIEAEAKYYLPQMFGQNHYQILTSPVELLQSLVKLYQRIKTQI
ncbi:nitric oxide reductase activation protein NorD [Sediminicola luteus]|uniref:NorD protein n=1 Tax=Sediminicola luteus TaxID=319238 RepID=A0A2A4GDW2_9FLAO|nr:VWA domain-containing protein [Sediminicola luteus]PCE66184.1 NorD protein [Sediminicola luteus]